MSFYNCNSSLIQIYWTSNLKNNLNNFIIYSGSILKSSQQLTILIQLSTSGLQFNFNLFYCFNKCQFNILGPLCFNANVENVEFLQNDILRWVASPDFCLPPSLLCLPTLIWILLSLQRLLPVGIWILNFPGFNVNFVQRLMTLNLGAAAALSMSLPHRWGWS